MVSPGSMHCTSMPCTFLKPNLAWVACRRVSCNVRYALMQGSKRASAVGGPAGTLCDQLGEQGYKTLASASLVSPSVAPESP